MARNMFVARLQRAYADLSNRIGLFVDLNFPPFYDVKSATRNFFLKPYSSWQGRRQLRLFEEEMAAAPERYKRCWARLNEDRIIYIELLGMHKVKSPFANAQNQLSELRDHRERLENHRWYQVSTQFDWSDLADFTSRCMAEWMGQVARCGLEICQDDAEVFVPEHFAPGNAAVILERVRGIRFPATGLR